MTHERRPLRRGWLIWALLFVPLFIIYMYVLNLYGWAVGAAAVLGMLGATLLWQRYARKRTWRAILLGRD